jgi:hypothetical protein
MSIPNTPHLEPVQSSPEVVFPDRQASTEQVCDWIRAWHLAHHVTASDMEWAVDTRAVSCTTGI